ncbi:MAG: GPW/gp25 family protein [Oxalobacter sp.]|nr:GPW/gp25 family protein [Oxalobacter sp.]
MAASQAYSVSLLETVDFAPASEAAEVLQNVRTILSTRRGTVPLDRDFGLSWSYIDKPLPVARMMLKAEIIQALQVYEPRAQVTAVGFQDSTTDAMDGILKPIVRIRLAETVSTENAASTGSTASGSGSTAETIDTTAASSGSADTSAITSMLMGQVSDIEERLRDIEQSDYTELYNNGES